MVPGGWWVGGGGRITVETWKVFRPVVADSYHFDEEPDAIKVRGRSGNHPDQH
jgi:hypothetical protein